MAKRDSKIPTTSGGLTKDAFQKFLTKITNTKQKVSDAQTAHASEFKRCDVLQIHPEALKLIQKLDRMSEEKRDNLLQAFDRYRSWMNWGAQLDLLESAADSVGESVGEQDDDFLDDDGQIPFGDDEDDAEPSGPAELNFAEGEREEGEPVLEETAQEWDGADDGGLDEGALDQGGQIFAAGVAAGALGKTLEENPHDRSYAEEAADIWEKGRIAGFRKFLDAEASAVADEREAEGKSDDNVVNLFDEGGDDPLENPMPLPVDGEASRAAL